MYGNGNGPNGMCPEEKCVIIVVTPFWLDLDCCSLRQIYPINAILYAVKL